MPGWNFKKIPSPMHNFVIDAGDLYIKLCNFCCLVSSVILAGLILLCNLYLSETTVVSDICSVGLIRLYAIDEANNKYQITTSSNLNILEPSTFTLSFMDRNARINRLVCK